MSHGLGVLMLAAVAGYWVLERAERQRGSLKSVGRFLGSLIILVSMLGVACRVWCLVTGTTGMCSFDASAKGKYCPYPGKVSSGDISPLPASK